MISAHNLLSRCLSYLHLLDHFRVPAYSQLRYINTWSPNTIGYHIVSLFLLKPLSLPALFHRSFVFFLSYLTNSYSCLADNDYLLTAKFNRILVSWGKFKPSDSSVYVDPYTKLSSLDTSTLFLVFFEELPSSFTLPSNVIAVFKSKLFKAKPNQHRLVYLSKSKYKSLVNVFNRLPIDPSFSKVLIVFEPQPFINYFIVFLKTRCPNAHIAGYIHSFLPSLPSEYFFTESSPHHIYINGDFQRILLEKFLLWPKSRISSVSASRYSDSIIPRLPIPTIFLPYDFDASSFTPSSLSFALSILHSFVDFSFLIPPIRNHPHATMSQKHIKLILLLKKQMNHIRDNGSSVSHFLPISGDKVSFVLGNSAVIFELLNAHIPVLHQSSNPTFDLLDPSLWPGISIFRVNHYISFYVPRSSSSLFDTSRVFSYEAQ